MPSIYLFLKICVFIVPELDASLSVERPSFDGLETLLVLNTPETMTVKLGSGTGPLSRGVPPRSLCGKLPQSHFLQGQTFGKLVYEEYTNHYKQEPNNTSYGLHVSLHLHLHLLYFTHHYSSVTLSQPTF